MRKTLAAILLLPALALADSSFQTIGYQGLLKKSDGTPETQTVQVTFRIFAASTGGTALWSEVQDVTPNSGGFYAVFLGSQTAFSSTLFDGSDRYLELQIQGDSTALTPRQQISSVPYALTAKNVNGGTSGTVNTGNVTATNVAISGAISVPTPTAAEQAARRDMAGQDGMVTRSKLAAVGQQISASTGSFSTSSTTYVDVTNASVTITTTGRPVFVGLMPDGVQSSLLGAHTLDGPGSTSVAYRIVRDTTDIAAFGLSSIAQLNAGYSIIDIQVPVSSLWCIDPVAAGTHTYKLQASRGNSSTSANVLNAKLVAYEL